MILSYQHGGIRVRQDKFIEPLTYSWMHSSHHWLMPSPTRSHVFHQCTEINSKTRALKCHFWNQINRRLKHDLPCIKSSVYLRKQRSQKAARQISQRWGWILVQKHLHCGNNKVREDKGFKAESATFGQVMYLVIMKSAARCSNKSPLSCNRLVRHVCGYKLWIE